MILSTSLLLAFTAVSLGKSINVTLNSRGPLPAPGYQWVPKLGSPVSARREAMAQSMFFEAIALAALAAQNVDPTDDVFLRYFEVGDAVLVKGIFDAVSGTITHSGKSHFPYGPEDATIAMLHIYEEESPFEEVDACNDMDAAAFENLSTVPNLRGGMTVDPNHLLLTLCPIVFEAPFRSLVDWDCDCLFGDVDSNFMVGNAAILLHELMHWRYLTSLAPNFSTLVSPVPGRIEDYPVPADAEAPPLPGRNDLPLDGYGPLNAHQLVAHANGDARKNADSYMYFALNKYWSWKCPERAPFGVSVDNFLGPPTAKELRDKVEGYYELPAR